MINLKTSTNKYSLNKHQENIYEYFLKKERGKLSHINLWLHNNIQEGLDFRKILVAKPEELKLYVSIFDEKK